MLDRRPRSRTLTVDQFFDEFAEIEDRYELIDGVPSMMAGGAVRHARVAGNIFSTLKAKLRGGSSEPFASDMGLRLNQTNLRYPDVAIYCDPRDLDPANSSEQGLRHPSVIFEVLSPSTPAFDRGGKVAEYQQLESVRTIVLVNAERRELEVHQRTGDDEWRKFMLGEGAPLEIAEPALTLTAEEIFGG